jgi:hypothetical protein
MFRRGLTASLLAVALFEVGCQDTPSPTPPPKLPTIKVKLLVNVLKGGAAQGDDDVTRPSKESIRNGLADAVKEANKLLSDCGVELELAATGIILDASNPDISGSENMDGNYKADKARDINKKAGEELKKAHGQPTKGFKIYLVTEITNKQNDEQGVGYWFPQEGSDAIEPGFSLIEASILKDGRLLAHEVCHGLGGLPDKNEKGNLMNPEAKLSDANNLSGDQCKKLREGAKQRE